MQLHVRGLPPHLFDEGGQLAVQILAVSEPSLADKLLDARRAATEKVLKKDAEIAAKYNK